jgi:hypothetical protein
MFNLTKTNATYFTATEEISLSLKGELYRLEDGRMVSNEDGSYPESLEGYEEDHKASLWVFEIDGELRCSDCRDEAVNEITEWLAEHPNKAAKLFAA